MKVKRVYTKLLTLPVGRHDNFFELGGHSLLAVKLAGQTALQGTPISINDLFTHPTIAVLAVRLSSQTPSNSRDLISVRPMGSRRPLFLVHEVSGLDSYYHRLAQAIEPEIPVWGLLAVPEDRPQLRTIEAMAARLVRNIRSVQAAGPYRIAGYSFGGILAYEVAKQLFEANHEVEFLGLIDTFAPENGKKLTDRRQTEAEYLINLCLLELDREANLVESMYDLHSEIRDHTQQKLRQILERSATLPFPDVLQELRTTNLHGAVIANAPIEQIERIVARVRTHVEAMLSYTVPAAVVPTCIFAAQKTDSLDPWRGWGEILQESRHRRIEIPGNHHSIMNTHVASLGTAIMQVFLETLDEGACVFVN
jgi:arthrofactin-type cyclic lipopeptide synthetase C